MSSSSGPLPPIHGFNSAVDSLVSEKKLEEITLCKAPLVQESSPGIGDEGNYLGYPVAAVKKPVTINGQPYDILQLAETDLSRNPWPIQSSENYEASSILVPPRLTTFARLSLDMIEMVQANKRSGGARYHLSGTAGLGKSVFAQILIHECVERHGRNAVVFVYQPTSDTVFVYTSGKTYVSNRETADILAALRCGWRKEIKNGTAGTLRSFWIFDSHTPVCLLTESKRAAIILVSSMGAIWDSSMLKKWTRCIANIRLVMPQWSADELEALRVQCFPNVSAEMVKRRFRMFGGNPRSVLEMADNSTLEETLLATIQTIDLMKAMREIGNTRASVTKDSSLAFYYKPMPLPALPSKRGPIYHSGHWSWASEWCLQQATNVLLGWEMEKISAFLRTARGGGQQALQGQVFETMMHRLINTVGCSGAIQCLPIDKKRKRGVDDGGLPSSTPFSLGPLIRKNFSSLADLDPNAYNVPLSRSFAAVDALLPSRGLLLQMTIAATHPIKLEMIEKLHKSGKFDEYLKTGEKVKLIFVVDSSGYEGFKPQQYQTQTKEAAKISPGWIQQYVWGVDIPKEIEQLRTHNKFEYDKLKTWDEADECLAGQTDDDF